MPYNKRTSQERLGVVIVGDTIGVKFPKDFWGVDVGAGLALNHYKISVFVIACIIYVILLYSHHCTTAD